MSGGRLADLIVCLVLGTLIFIFDLIVILFKCGQLRR